MLAQSQWQVAAMASLPTAVTALETTAEDLKLRVGIIETQNTMTDQVLTNMQTSLSNNTSRIMEIEQVITMNTGKPQGESGIVYAAKKEEVRQVSEKLELAGNKIQQLCGVIKEQAIKIETLDAQQRGIKNKVFHANCNMLVSGIIRQDGENCKEVVKSFFRHCLRIAQEVDVIKAHRVGKEDSTTILFVLAQPALKGLIFKNVKNLKGLTNRNGEYLLYVKF